MVLALGEDERAATYARAVKLAEAFVRDAQTLVLRVSLARHAVRVEGASPEALVRAQYQHYHRELGDSAVWAQRQGE